MDSRLRMWCKKVASCDRNAEVRFESGNLSVMNQKEKRKMTTITIIKMHETEAKRFWGVQKRLLTIPLSEKQILRVKGDSYKDA